MLENGGLPLAQRLHDKDHSWSDLQKLIPHMITEGLIGYTFSCPDMIGGGLWTAFLDSTLFDPDLVVRSAQIHALMPMMQFSAAPWRILELKHLEAVKKAVKIRQKFTPYILQLARESATSGAPIVRSMEYCFPEMDFQSIQDQFMLGDQILVAPVVEKGKFEREIILPYGKWIADDGRTYEGGKSYTIEVPFDRLPYFVLDEK
ncbi:MAG: hypothetical protein HC905_28860 [Bacteroidales bacterium]|nr:hypothetical protein [Bacteroidales bacterium]